MAERTQQSGWDGEDEYWRKNFRSRPYASSERDYEFYQPGYRFGYESAYEYTERDWDDIEPDLSRSWSSYEHRGMSTWEQVKHAVRDAWNRVTGKRTVGAR